MKKSGHLTFLSRESSTYSTRASKRQKTKRRVSLHDDVAVIPIPMRHEYSDLSKGRLWSSASELYQNAARNSIEFAAEGWNWRTVIDDEHMVLSASGERIHPIHLNLTRSVLEEVLELELEKVQPKLKTDDAEDSQPPQVNVCEGSSAVESPLTMDAEPLTLSA